MIVVVMMAVVRLINYEMMISGTSSRVLFWGSCCIRTTSVDPQK